MVSRVEHQFEQKYANEKILNECFIWWWLQACGSVCLYSNAWPEESKNKEGVFEKAVILFSLLLTF